MHMKIHLHYIEKELRVIMQLIYTTFMYIYVCVCHTFMYKQTKEEICFAFHLELFGGNNKCENLWKRFEVMWPVKKVFFKEKNCVLLWNDQYLRAQCSESAYIMQINSLYVAVMISKHKNEIIAPCSSTTTTGIQWYLLNKWRPFLLSKNHVWIIAKDEKVGALEQENVCFQDRAGRQTTFTSSEINLKLTLIVVFW